jgi:hypothetical protein
LVGLLPWEVWDVYVEVSSLLGCRLAGGDRADIVQRA